MIAGGRSLRFGGEKAVAQFAGRSMLEWAAQRLQRTCCHVAVNARPDTEAAALAQRLGLRVLYDFPGHADGPLAGVHAGLVWARQMGAEQLATSPCDAPLLPDDLFQRLLGSSGGGAAMVETTEGLQPICAVWPATALPQVAAALADGKHPAVWRMLDQLAACRVLMEPATLFTNVNTREDLARLESAYQG